MAASNVADLRRIERLAVDLACRWCRLACPLVSTNYVNVEVDGVDSVHEWRAAARLAARQRGWQVRTGFGRGRKQAFAVRVDPEAERGWTGWFKPGLMRALVAHPVRADAPTRRRSVRS